MSVSCLFEFISYFMGPHAVNTAYPAGLRMFSIANEDHVEWMTRPGIRINVYERRERGIDSTVVVSASNIGLIGIVASSGASRVAAVENNSICASPSSPFYLACTPTPNPKVATSMNIIKKHQSQIMSFLLLYFEEELGTCVPCPA